MHTRQVKALHALCIVLAILSAARGQTAYDHAIKLSVLPASPTLAVGQETKIDLGLCDATNKPVEAPHDMTVKITTSFGNSDIAEQSVQFKKGEKWQTFTVRPDRSGIMEIRAINPEFLQAGARMLVRPAPATQSATPQAETIRNLGNPRISERGIAAGEPAPAERESAERAPPTPRIIPPPRLPATRAAPSRGDAMAGAPPPVAPAAPIEVIDLSYSPQRELLADGQDFVTVTAFVMNEVPTSPIQLFFETSDGSLLPKPLTIGAGQVYATGSLTCLNSATISLAYKRALPDVRVDGASTFSIQFGPVIKAIKLVANPPDISLFEQTDVVAHLLDDKGHDVKSDLPWTIALDLTDGDGELDTTSIAIPAGQSTGQTVFHPRRSGLVHLTASTDALPTSNALQLSVTWPIFSLIISAVAGLLGGVLAYYAGGKKQSWRIWAGIPIGFVLYWAVFVGLVSKVSPAIALFPGSQFVLPLLGGWMGTALLDSIMSMMGFGKTEETGT